jgi:DNA replication protein DnaC
MITIKKGKQPKLKMPDFNVDGKLAEKLDEYEITKLMNKSNFTLFLGRAGSGKTSLMVSLLNTKALFKKVFHNIYVFMPNNSRKSMKNDLFDKLPANQVFDELSLDDLQTVYDTAKENALENYKTLIIFDDVQKQLKDKQIEKLFLHIVNNRRHAKISLFLCCQNYFQIPKQVRSGLTDLFVFKSSKEELNQIFVEQIELYRDLFLEVIEKCYQNSHDFLYINSNSQRCFSNWDEIIITKEN